MIQFTKPNGTPVWVRPDAVDVVHQNDITDQPGATVLGFSGPGAALLVRETVQEALDKLHRRAVEWKR